MFFDPQRNYRSGPGTRIVDLISGELLGSYPNSDDGRSREFCANGKLMARMPAKNWLVVHELPSIDS